jgi:hypothetical protein
MSEKLISSERHGMKKAPLLSPLDAAGAWFVILVLAVANGALREAELIPRFGVAAGTTVSGLILVVAVATVTWALLRWRRPRTTAQTWRVGVGWLAATVVFECAFGRFVQQKPWPEILAAYTFANGNLWPLVLLAVLGAPFLLRPRVPHRDGTAPPYGRR